jgi:hypothetical protein
MLIVVCVCVAACFLCMPIHYDVIEPTFLPPIHYLTSASLSPFIFGFCRLIVVFEQRPFHCRCCHRGHFSTSLTAPASTTPASAAAAADAAAAPAHAAAAAAAAAAATAAAASAVAMLPLRCRHFRRCCRCYFPRHRCAAAPMPPALRYRRCAAKACASATALRYRCCAAATALRYRRCAAAAALAANARSCVEGTIYLL